MSLGNVGKYSFNEWRCFTRKKTVRKSSYNEKKNEYSALGAELKKQPCNVKDQHKFFKNQINVINDNREDGVETENGEITDNLYHSHVCDEKKDLIHNIFTYGLRDKDFHLTNFVNQIGLKILSINI